MKLVRIKLTNFRCYQELEVELHPQVTVLVAENGQGKTTLLDAIRVALWPYLGSFDLARPSKSDKGNRIDYDDVRLANSADQQLERQFPCRIEATGDYGFGIETWTRYKEKESQKTPTLDDSHAKIMTKRARELQTDIRDVEQPAKSLFVFGYYGTGRLWGNAFDSRLKKKTRSKNDEFIRTFAYQDCMVPLSNFQQFSNWFTHEFLKLREAQIKHIESGDDSPETAPSSASVTAVQKAVNTLLGDTGWQNLEYSQTHDKSLVLSHPDKGKLKLDQLSDGIKNMVAMVADIAYRCCHLNSHLRSDGAAKSSGLVLIDEVDMHLHPKWQQTVIQGLTNAFPNIQFVVTSHSPQVLSTVAPESIRIISWEDHTPVIVTPDFSLGAEPQQLLEDIQGVTPRPQNVEIVNKLNRYLDLVNDDKWDSSEAQALRTELDSWAGDHDPVLVKADMDIRLRQRRRG